MAVSAPTNLAASAASPSRIGLTWTNAQAYIGIEVQRSPNGSTGWTVVSGTLSGSATSWTDTSCQDGTKYYYRLECAAGEESAYSNTANATTPLAAPSGLSGTSASDGTEVVLTWADNCQNETGFKVYKDGSLLATLGSNVVTYTATGLTAGRTYSFYVNAYNSLVTSAASNTITILTDDPPARPSGLTAIATGTTTVQLNWVDNADNETRYYIEKSSTSASAGFAVVGTYLNANVTSLLVDSLTSNTQYWFRVRAWNKSGYSAYCAVATATTWAAIAQPTNLVVVAASGTAVDLYFDDNSELEDGHSVEMKVGGGAYAEIIVLEPNRYSYRKTGLTKGTTYTFKVRAVQGVSYSAYSDEVAVTTPTNVSAPANLAVSEYQDTWVKLTWDHVAAADAYQVKVSTDDITFTSAGIVFTPNTHELKVTGLTAGTLYYFNCAAKSVAGWSADSASISQTTRTSYSFSTFQRLVRRSSPNLIFLVELNPAMALKGWTLSSGKTYTYEISFDERGAELETVEQNGEELTEQTSIANVESNAGSWWHDTVNGKVYVHPNGSDSPNNYVLVGAFWLYYTTKSRQDALTVFNDHCYIPIVSDIPDITQEISPYYEGNFVITHGSISFFNRQISGVNYWDDKFGKYLFVNRRAKVLAGGDGFTYSEFVTINTGIMDAYDCTDQRFTVSLRDRRDGINKTLPIARYTLDEFPALGENAVDLVKPFGYGVITNAVPVCIDTTNRVFEFHNGRITSVEAVYQNGATLTVDVDYFIDYYRGRIILARDLTYSTDDIILVDFTGQAYDDGVAISRGPDIFRDIMTRFLGMTNDDLDLESIVTLRTSNTTELSLYLWKETDSQEIIRRIERSIEGYTFQNADGKLGIKAALTSAPSDISYIPNARVMDFAMSRDKGSVYSTINVYYGEDPSIDKYALQQCDNVQVTYKHKIDQQLDVYTALTTSTQATSLGSNIIEMLDRAKVHFTVPRCLFTSQPGDLVYLTRDRYFGSNPTANNKLLRILSISKGFQGGTTQITAEEV